MALSRAAPSSACRCRYRCPLLTHRPNRYSLFPPLPHPRALFHHLLAVVAFRISFLFYQRARANDSVCLVFLITNLWQNCFLTMTFNYKMNGKYSFHGYTLLKKKTKKKNEIDNSNINKIWYPPPQQRNNRSTINANTASHRERSSSNSWFRRIRVASKSSAPPALGWHWKPPPQSCT